MTRKAQKAKGTPGRPSLYTDELSDKIVELLAGGQSLSEISRREDMPGRSTLTAWIANDVGGFRAKYVSAREMQAEWFADEIIEISDDGTNDWMLRQQGEETVEVVNHEHIQRSKLRVDARKWLMSKMAPKKYGEKLQTELTGKDGRDLIPAEAEPAKVALALLAVLRAAKPTEPTPAAS